MKSKRSKNFFDVNKYEIGLYSIIFVLLEILQIYCNQPILLFINHIVVLFCLTIISFKFNIPKLGFFILLIYEIFETSAWLTIGTNITFQIINAIDFQYITKSHPEYFIYGLVSFIFLIFFVRIPLPVSNLLVTNHFIYIITLSLFSMLFYFLISLYHSFYPFNDMFFNLNDMTATELSIYKAFSTKPEIISIPPKRRNLILFQIESFEKGPIGTYNRYYPESMPFISQLSKNATIFDNLDSQPYTTWTAAGTFTTLCSFPQIINDPKYIGNRRHSHLSQWSKMPCIPTFLKKAEYNMFYYAVGSVKLMGTKEFLISKGYKANDYFEHGFNHDVPLYNHVIEKVLPEIVKKFQPFVLHVVNEDTHPFYYTDQACKNQNNVVFKNRKKVPPILSSFNCIDQIAKNFTMKLKKLGLNDENTLFVIYGDHICYGDKTGLYDDRKLVNIFPFMKKSRNSKSGTYYDFAPTILSQLNISYKPKFPFGADLFSNKTGKFPNEEDFKFIYGMYAKQMHKSAKIKCKDKEGFCTGYM